MLFNYRRLYRYYFLRLTVISLSHQLLICANVFAPVELALLQIGQKHSVDAVISTFLVLADEGFTFEEG